MICERCKIAKATVFFTQIIHGQMQKVDLCENCARDLGATSTSGFSLAELLLTLKDEPRASSSESEEPTCPTCGMTAADFRKTARVGCGMCYETFRTLIMEAIKETQKSVQHRGKVPTRYRRILERRDRLESLQQRLRQAVAEEEFEVAAELRDQIRLLEAERPSAGV